MKRPKLLFLTQTLPYPPHGGVENRTFNILRLLSEHFEVTALCFYRKGGAVRGRIGEAVSALSAYGNVEAFPIPQEHSKLRLLWDHARSLIAHTVYTRFAYQSQRFSSRLTSLLQQDDFALIHMDSMDLSFYLPMLAGRRVICTHHNVESALLRRRAPAERPALKRAYVRFQARLTEAEERRWCPRVRLNVCVSDRDAEDLRTIAQGGNYIVVPNGVDVDFFVPDAARGVAEQSGIVFVGGTSWFPNRDALGYFAETLLPLIRQQHPGVSVTWVGKATPGEREYYSSIHGITMTGYVPDVRPHAWKGACYVVPLRVGGGTRLKIVDGWAMGKAVVSTSVGCEGLAAVDGANILIRDEPQSFADAVCKVLTDPQLRSRLGQAARETAVSTYSWKKIGAGMHERYDSLLNGADS